MKRILFSCAALMLAATLWCCGGDDAADPAPKPDDLTLDVSPLEIEVPAEGLADGVVVTVTTTSTSWKITRPSDKEWAHATITTGLSGTAETRVVVDENEGEARTSELVVSAPGCEDRTIVVRQEGVPEKPVVQLPDPDDMEDTAAPEADGMPSDAMTLYKKMFAGINIGNTLESCNAGSDDWTQWTGSETMWGNPKVSQTFIDGCKQAGFNAVRIPVAWVAGHISDFDTWKIDLEWLARVKEVVDYCYAAGDMYAIINIHWDGGWLENNPTAAKQDEVNAIQARLWQQIAKYFRDYDEHLLFAGTNEVHAGYNAPTQENLTAQQSYNQTFVDAVRATGGRNTYRVLVTQTYNTNIWYGAQSHVMSEDPTPGRQMLEVHCYTPWAFCGDDASVSTWGTEQEKTELENEFKQLGRFFEQGIPFVLGEYGALYQSSQSNNAAYTESRNNWVYYATRYAKENGYVPFLWDRGQDAISRSTGAVLPAHAGYVEALMRGAADGQYPD